MDQAAGIRAAGGRAYSPRRGELRIDPLRIEIRQGSTSAPVQGSPRDHPQQSAPTAEAAPALAPALATEATTPEASTMPSEASKKKALQKKAAAAAKRGSAAPKAAAAAGKDSPANGNGTAEHLPEELALEQHDRTCTGVLASHPLSRDIHVSCRFPFHFYSHCPISLCPPFSCLLEWPLRERHRGMEWKRAVAHRDLALLEVRSAGLFQVCDPLVRLP